MLKARAGNAAHVLFVEPALLKGLCSCAVLHVQLQVDLQQRFK